MFVSIFLLRSNSNFYELECSIICFLKWGEGGVDQISYFHNKLGRGARPSFRQHHMWTAPYARPKTLVPFNCNINSFPMHGLCYSCACPKKVCIYFILVASQRLKSHFYYSQNWKLNEQKVMFSQMFCH